MNNHARKGWWCVKKYVLILIHKADPQLRSVVNIVFAHVVRSSVLPKHFSKQNNFKRKQCLLLAILWVWPSGSLAEIFWPRVF